MCYDLLDSKHSPPVPPFSAACSILIIVAIANDADEPWCSQEFWRALRLSFACEIRNVYLALSEIGVVLTKSAEYRLQGLNLLNKTYVNLSNQRVNYSEYKRVVNTKWWLGQLRI
jgi:hypothetical protein